MKKVLPLRCRYFTVKVRGVTVGHVYSTLRFTDHLTNQVMDIRWHGVVSDSAHEIFSSKTEAVAFVRSVQRYTPEGRTICRLNRRRSTCLL